MEGPRGLRITTWNASLSPIRNPFGYQPWRNQRTFAAMFDILEADIVIMQETKIQRKDLQDDMVLVPGWDVYFSLPKHKKGYSGVAIYTRNSVCAPIRAEEGITGILTPPNSSTSFRDLPEKQRIGGYPRPDQLRECSLDFATLDSEGRCVVLEFPAFVLIGVYCPATRDETRDEFRLGFLNALDARVRNLVAAGKNVFLTGDLNIMCGELDTANLQEIVRKRGLTAEEFFSSPARKLLNELLLNGKVYGDREEGREKPLMWDLCRGFHPERRGMFTCWEQKINARPGNYGSRIDYVLCSEDCKEWFCDANIQEGLMGSDHCPVYAVLKDKVIFKGDEVHIRDLMSRDMFRNGVRLRHWSPKDLLPTSAKLIPEFDRRRSIRDMFTKKPPPATEDDSSTPRILIDNPEIEASIGDVKTAIIKDDADRLDNKQDPQPELSAIESPVSLKRTNSLPIARAPKKARSKATPPNLKSQLSKGQSSLKGFFKPQSLSSMATDGLPSSNTKETNPLIANISNGPKDVSTAINGWDNRTQEDISDPIAAKESWSKLLGSRVVPRCEHNEPCISYVTKKPGINCGRSFFTCARPLGPSGQKEKNTQWRCNTFIWSSDWTGLSRET
ncbi:DNA lyase-like protein [Xylogone sp. PMI_703]|nr:DNA lyase-like protein [Xylogone sp. PMI_703]